MKDYFLSLTELDIQLKKKIGTLIEQSSTFHNPSPYKSHPSYFNNIRIIYPKKFRELRALAIASWYFPESLSWKIVLDLTDLGILSLDFDNKGLDHSIEFSILLTSKEIMLKYLKETETFSARELFGTILRDDLSRALKSLKFKRKSNKVIKTIRRKGYKDHGSRRPEDRWLESYDFSFTEYQNLKEEKETIYLENLTLLKEKLEDRGSEAEPPSSLLEE